MKCIKCGHENSNLSSCCKKCKIVLPNTKNFSVSDAMGYSFITGVPDEEISSVSIENFKPLKKIKESVELLLDDKLTEEDFTEQLYSILSSINHAIKATKEMPSETRELMVNFSVLSEEGYNMLKKAVDRMIMFFESDDVLDLDDGLEIATDAAAIFCKAIITGKENLKETSI